MSDSTNDIRVLLIEDGVFFAELIEYVLADTEGRLTFAMEHVDRLSAGLERLSEGTFDVVLLDLILPDSLAGQTFLKVHEHSPDVPIVVFTGVDDETATVDAVRFGAQDYLIKAETDGRLLKRVLQYAIERSHIMNELREKNTKLKQLNDAMTDREDQMIALKEQVDSLLVELHRQPMYGSTSIAPQ